MEIISTGEAAEILGITRRAVQQLLKKGVIKGQKLERDWMVDKASVLEYKKIREQRQAKGQAEDN